MSETQREMRRVRCPHHKRKMLSEKKFIDFSSDDGDSIHKQSKTVGDDVAIKIDL